MTEDEKVGWHHQFNGCEFEQVLASKGIGDGQGSLTCSSLWDRIELGTTQQLNNNRMPVVRYDRYSRNVGNGSDSWESLLGRDEILMKS